MQLIHNVSPEYYSIIHINPSTGWAYEEAFLKGHDTTISWEGYLVVDKVCDYNDSGVIHSTNPELFGDLILSDRGLCKWVEWLQQIGYRYYLPQ